MLRKSLVVDCAGEATLLTPVFALEASSCGAVTHAFTNSHCDSVAPLQMSSAAFPLAVTAIAIISSKSPFFMVRLLLLTRKARIGAAVRHFAPIIRISEGK